jgi:hypothetical protein
MLLDSARELKRHLAETVLARFTAGGPAATRLSVPAGPVSSVPAVQPSIALGIARQGANDFRLAVRCQRQELMAGPEINKIRSEARNEVDVQFIGTASKLAVPWGQQRHRSLKIGTSLGHVAITAGTLGCFVLERDKDGLHILSNNHVLANENKGRKGDAILQPARFDEGKEDADVAARLEKTVRLRKEVANRVDAAIARVVDGIDADTRSLRGLGKLAGLGPDFLDEGTEVAKLGRTTGLTRGRVTAFDLDNVVVEFGMGNLRFDGQIEIEGSGEKAFSAGGDSGSLIVEAGTRLGVALLFAGTQIGGTNNKGLTFANPLRAVLDALKVDLALN